MSRPTREESEELRRLEVASMQLQDALITAGVLAVRLRQALRRDGRLGGVLGPGQEELGRMVDDIDRAKELLAQVLEAKQKDRSGRG